MPFVDRPITPEVALPSGETRPALGLGTWRFGEAAARRGAEVNALRQALEMGWRLIDTAEMYGEGGAETVTGEALAGALRAGVRRSELFVVSKVLPENAGARALQAACEASLRRLQIEQIDLYLLHWRGAVPLAETVRGFEQLQRRGLIRLWGVSNFDLDDMRELGNVPGGRACASNQVYYSLSQRGVEHDLLPWQRVQQMPLMAYSPFDQGELVDHPRLRPVAERHRATPAQVALAWLLHQPGVMAIPKAGNALHLRHNWAAQQLRLTAEDLAELDLHFAPPRTKQLLAMR
ncbi:hypothetical protein IP87_07140 [beta proteobacterium AAP121]|nr:hypothetical protein IP80_17625 [beta proteobacterium AAP65]KPF98885.1 hypothetical protein IP87_07140 [beta proteobacterium AAP121]